ELARDPPVSVRVVPFLEVVPNPLTQRIIGRLSSSSLLSRISPFVIARALDTQHSTHPLHLMGVPVVINELEADHQVVSAAKYFVAFRRIARSSASLSFSARSRLARSTRSAFSTRRRASSSSADSGRSVGAVGTAPAAFRA